MSISLTPDQIRDLARQINEAISGLTNIEDILADTRADLARARGLERRANSAKLDDVIHFYTVFVITDAKYSLFQFVLTLCMAIFINIYSDADGNRPQSLRFSTLLMFILLLLLVLLLLLIIILSRCKNEDRRKKL